MNLHRVRFYSKYDSSIDYYLLNAETIMRKFDSTNDFSNYNINEIIEFYNIKEYINAGLSLESWSDADNDFFENVVKEYLPLIGRFFNTITDNNIMDLYFTLDFQYQKDFWSLIEKYKVYKKISQNAFQTLIGHPDVSFLVILKHPNVTKYYGAEIKEKFLLNIKSAELLLDKYEMKRIHKQDEICLPEELTLEDKEKIICNYIEGTDPNLNYLRLIINIQSNNEFKISDQTRLNAKKRTEKEEVGFFENNAGLCMETSVSFPKNQDETVLVESEGQHQSYSYSLKWLQENADYNTILNNFIHLFEFVDLQMRLTHANKISEMGVFERYLFTRSKKAYITGMAFEQKDILAKLQMTGYYQELERMNIRLEEVIEWFFKCYLKDEFQIENFSIKMPSIQSLYFEKCRAVLPEMESTLKQFSLLIHDGFIDHDLLQMSSSHLTYKDIPSLLKEKYVYGCGDEYRIVSDQFFSDQSLLSYIERVGDNYNNLFDLIIHENVRLDDYLDFQREDINWLLEHLYIIIDVNGFVKPHNINQLYVLKDLYHNGVLSYWHYPNSFQEIIKELEKNGVVIFEDSLLTRPEQDYFNYFLNKASFNNALDLRNSYSHGTQLPGDGNESTHKGHYLTFLRLFILLIIKINDEFCIAESKEYIEKS